MLIVDFHVFKFHVRVRSYGYDYDEITCFLSLYRNQVWTISFSSSTKGAMIPRTNDNSSILLDDELEHQSLCMEVEPRPWNLRNAETSH